MTRDTQAAPGGTAGSEWNILCAVLATLLVGGIAWWKVVAPLVARLAG